MAKRRLFLTGSERAQFEHVFGPLTVDEQDTRFVLVDEETEKKIFELPSGVPPHRFQASREKIEKMEAEAQGFEHSPQFGVVSDDIVRHDPEEPTPLEPPKKGDN